LNAAAMAPDRVEEELFGTEDRTGGGPRKVGALEESHGGTLYIDEVADMPVETQGKVLRVLVEQKFLRLGGSQKVAVDVRIISSTSRDLEREIQEGRFREDLYHRLNVVPLRVPGLAERREDIPDLIQYFVADLLLFGRAEQRRFAVNQSQQRLANLAAHLVVIDARQRIQVDLVHQFAVEREFQLLVFRRRRGLRPPRSFEQPLLPGSLLRVLIALIYSGKHNSSYAIVGRHAAIRGLYRKPQRGHGPPGR